MWTPQGGAYISFSKDSQICLSGNQLAGTAIDSDRTHEPISFTFCLEHFDASVFVALHNPELVRMGPSLHRREGQLRARTSMLCATPPSLATPPLPILVLFIFTTSIHFYATLLTHMPHLFNKHVPHPLHVCHTPCMCATPLACVIPLNSVPHLLLVCCTPPHL